MIHTDPKHLVARAKAYDAQERPTDLDRPAIAVHSPQWQPMPSDITLPNVLFEYLSPEVRRFAVVMESLLRETGDKQDDRPRAIYQHMLREAARLKAAIMHQGVTDFLGNALPAENVDRNPRRVANVLREAASVACNALLVADACGALEERE